MEIGFEGMGGELKSPSFLLSFFFIIVFLFMFLFYFFCLVSFQQEKKLIFLFVCFERIKEEEEKTNIFSQRIYTNKSRIQNKKNIYLFVIYKIQYNFLCSLSNSQNLIARRSKTKNKKLTKTKQTQNRRRRNRSIFSSFLLLLAKFDQLRDIAGVSSETNHLNDAGSIPVKYTFNVFR